jgi:hypothetical protein
VVRYPEGANESGAKSMPRLDSEGDVILRIAGIEKGPIPQMTNTPKYLAIRGVTAVGPRDVLISEAAARELRARLTELLPVADSA